MRCKCGGRKCASAICSTMITTTRFPCFPSLPLPRFACALAPGVSPALLLPGRLSPLPCFEPSLGSSLRSSRSLPSRPRSRFLPSLYRSRSSLGAPPSRSLPPSVLPSPSTLASLAPSSSVLPPPPTPSPSFAVSRPSCFLFASRSFPGLLWLRHPAWGKRGKGERGKDARARRARGQNARGTRRTLLCGQRRGRVRKALSNGWSKGGRKARDAGRGMQEAQHGRRQHARRQQAAAACTRMLAVARRIGARAGQGSSVPPGACAAVLVLDSPSFRPRLASLALSPTLSPTDPVPRGLLTLWASPQRLSPPAPGCSRVGPGCCRVE